MPLNLDAHPTSKISKTLCHNPTTPTVYHPKKWENTRLLDGNYVVTVTSLPYPRFVVIINIVSKANIAYMLQLATSHSARAWTSPKCPLRLGERKENLVYSKHLTTYSCFYARWIMTTTNSFMLQCIPTMRSCDFLSWHV